jgi:protocatechuate 3,4-dioxygenase beta subunit
LKKLLFVALTVLIAAAFWRWAGDDPGSADGPVGSGPTTRFPSALATEEHLVSESTGLSVRSGGAEARTQSANAVAETELTGTLVARFTWERDSRLAEDLAVEAVEVGRPRGQPIRMTTDGSGRATFEELPAGSTALCLPSGHVFKDIEVIAGEQREIDLVIPSTCILRGRVLDASGEAFAGAEIWAIASNTLLPLPHVVARSAADGSFVIQDPAWITRLSARSLGHQPSLDAIIGQNSQFAGEASELLLQLGPPGGRVRGRVLGAAGEAVSGARVLVGSPWGDVAVGPDGFAAYTHRPLLLSTDPLGEFHVPHDLAPGTQPVMVVAKGLSAWRREVEVIQDETSELLVQLDPALRVVGVVQDSSGRPVVGALVSEWRAEAGGIRRGPSDGAPWTLSDASGRFSLEGLAAGRCTIEARIPGRPRLDRVLDDVELVAGREVNLVLTFFAGAALTGRLIDSQGEGLVGWHVELSSDDGIHGLDVAYDETRKDGGFAFRDLNSEHIYNLSVRAPGESCMHPRARFEGLLPGDEAHRIVVEDTLPANGGIRGRLVDGAGGSPTDVEVVCTRDGFGGFIRPFLDSASGEFRFEALTPGRYRVRVLRGFVDVVSSDGVDLARDQTVDVGDLSTGDVGEVFVTFPLLSHDELEEVEVELFEVGPDGGLGNRSIEFFRSKDGLRSFPVQVGDWRLEIWAGLNYAPARDLRIEAGATLSLAIETRPGMELSFDVEFPPSAAQADWIEFELRDPSGTLVDPLWRELQPDIDSEGVHDTWMVLPRGDWVIAARTSTGLSGSLSVTVDEGSEEDGGKILLR